MVLCNNILIQKKKMCIKKKISFRLLRCVYEIRIECVFTNLRWQLHGFIGTSKISPTSNSKFLKYVMTE